MTLIQDMEPVEKTRVATPAGALPARIIRPAAPSGLPPLVVLHGISRNAGELAALFRPHALASGRTVVVPHFSRRRWPHFQRPCDAARPDQALLALLRHLETTDPAFAGPVDLFGHSGGAQLAHRFAMLYPHRARRLNLVAAGWYCLPDATMAWPYGLRAGDDRRAAIWTRRNEAALAAYLRLEVAVFVGSRDVERDEALRKTSDLDAIQGRTRLERAKTYVRSFRLAALTRDVRPAITLTQMKNVAHDAAQAVTEGRLARIACAAAPAPLARAI